MYIIFRIHLSDMWHFEFKSAESLWQKFVWVDELIMRGEEWASACYGAIKFEQFNISIAKWNAFLSIPNLVSIIFLSSSYAPCVLMAWVRGSTCDIFIATITTRNSNRIIINMITWYQRANRHGQRTCSEQLSIIYVELCWLELSMVENSEAKKKRISGLSILLTARPKHSYHNSDISVQSIHMENCLLCHWTIRLNIPLFHAHFKPFMHGNSSLKIMATSNYIYYSIYNKAHIYKYATTGATAAIATITASCVQVSIRTQHKYYQLYTQSMAQYQHIIYLYTIIFIYYVYIRIYILCPGCIVHNNILYIHWVYALSVFV